MMNLLDPPTDNLYKFLAVGGMVLFLAGVIYPRLFFQEASREYLLQLHGRDELEVHRKFTNERLTTLERRRQQTEDKKSALEQRLSRLTSVPRGAGSSQEIDKLESQIKDTERQLEAIADASYQTRLDLELKQAQTKHAETVDVNQRRDSRYFMVSGWVVAAFGLWWSVTGFVWWHQRLQKFQDRIVQREASARLQAKIEVSNNREPDTPVTMPTEVEIVKPAK